VQKILGQGEREIMARALGQSVMQELKAMDKVAYIRFASVYRSFQDVDDFNNVIRDLDPQKNSTS
jgi:transcriptional repressor NrdR